MSALALGLAAAGLFINYLVQGSLLRRQQAELRAAYGQPAGGQAAQATQTPGALVPDPVVVFGTSPEPAPRQTPAILTREAASDRFIPLMRRNNDVIGWLRYAAFPEMDFVVVQRDNTHYLNRSFTGERNLAGTVFLEQSNHIRPRDTNLILHGHNMADGTMFGKLARLLNPAILRQEPLMQFDTLYQDALYVPYALSIFSVDTKADNYFNIIRTGFQSDEDLGGYVGWLRANSSLVFPTQVAASDRLLTLVTCHGQDESERLVLALRAVRPDEDPQALRALLETGIVRR